MFDTKDTICDLCTNKTCMFQSGIQRSKCDFYMPHLEPDNCGNYVVQQEPCKDCVSRQAVLDTCLNIYFNGYKEKDLLYDIKKLPSVTSQPDKWIPVSEQLPEDGTWNIFTDGKMISVERYKADALDHFFPEGRWFSFEDAIWWMPLPELPKTESEG